MNFTLNILDKDGLALDVSNLTVKSDVISISDVITQNVAAMTLGAGNTYDIVFPADATTDPLSVSAITFAEDAALNFNLVAGELLAGVTKSITIGATPITNFDIGVLTGGGVDTYDATVLVTGEDITITIDGNVTTGANIAVETLTDNDTVDISVVASGYHTYTNTVRVYEYDVDVSIKLIQNITDPLDAEYRKPYPFFFELLEPCSYNVHVYNAQSLPFGMISYNEGTTEPFSVGAANAVYDTCAPDVISITQNIVIRTIPNCGGTSPVLWDEDFTIEGITTTEYKPSVLLERPFDCCEVIDTIIAINPQEIELSSDSIHNTCTLTAIDPMLVYTMTDPEGTVTALADYDGTEVDAGILTALGFTYTPTMLGTYTLSVSISNCCTTIETLYTFDVCNSWTVTNTECNIIEVSNLSATIPVTFTIKELTDLASFTTVTISEVLQENIVVAPGTTTQIDLQVDNLYTVDVTDSLPSTDDREYIFLLDCNIKKCKKQLLLNYLCDGGADCDELTRSKAQDSWLRFASLEDIVYQKWDDWKQQQTIYNTLSINDIMEDVITLGKALDVIISICGSCGISNDCSCEKRYTCSYTITNGGYLVPTRYASIIVPSNGTDCGCN